MEFLKKILFFYQKDRNHINYKYVYLKLKNSENLENVQVLQFLTQIGSKFWPKIAKDGIFKQNFHSNLIANTKIVSITIERYQNCRIEGDTLEMTTFFHFLEWN